VDFRGKGVRELLKLTSTRASTRRTTPSSMLIDFYVKEHNTQMPHHAFDGQTPDEVYLGHADRVRDRLTAVRHQARRARKEANRGESCRVCTLPTQRSTSVINAVANAPP
jgi:hypothetical protein